MPITNFEQRKTHETFKKSALVTKQRFSSRIEKYSKYWNANLVYLCVCKKSLSLDLPLTSCTKGAISVILTPISSPAAEP